MNNKEEGDRSHVIEELMLEVQRLKQKIQEYGHESTSKPNSSLTPDLSAIEDKIDKVSNRVDSFVPLAEDVLSLRVFEKSKSYLINWITIGGVAAIVGGILLFLGAWSYTKQLVTSQVNTISESQLPGIIKDEAGRQVENYFKQHQNEYDDQVKVLYTKIRSEMYATVQRISPYGLSNTGGMSAVPVNSTDTSLLDYTMQMGEVGDQGSEGSVVGFAIAAAIEYQIFKTTNQKVQLSVREIYNLTRKRVGTLSVDQGAALSDAITTVKTEGVVLNSVWPYRAGKYTEEPPAEIGTAIRYKISKAVKVTNKIDEIKATLGAIGPLVIGLTIYEEFESKAAAKTGIIAMPSSKSQVVGGHAVCLVGYDDKKKMFKFRNSWTAAWGDKGYGYLPYAYIDDNLVEVWALSM